MSEPEGWKSLLPHPRHWSTLGLNVLRFLFGLALLIAGGAILYLGVYRLLDPGTLDGVPMHLGEDQDAPP